MAKSAYDKLHHKIESKKRTLDLDRPFSLRAKISSLLKILFGQFFFEVLLPINAKSFFELPVNDATQENFKKKNLSPNTPKKHKK